jgi:osmoprotectant transport system substrate-binding protein
MFRKVWRAVLLVALTACVAVAHAAGGTLVVGGKNFTEQRLLAEVTAQYLRAKGFTVDVRPDMGSSLLRQAQEQGQVDVYWEYTGTSLITYNKITEHLAPDQAYQRVKTLDAQKGIVWLTPSKANNTYAIAFRRADKDRLKLVSISDLAAAIKAGKELSVAAGAEFVARQDGMAGLEKAYGFDYPRSLIRKMDIGLTYEALRQGRTDLAIVYSNDGRVGAFGFETLKDDKNFFPSYALVPVARADTLKKYPQLAGLMNALAAKLDDATMRSLNAQVDVERKSVESVARGFLTQQHLL